MAEIAHYAFYSERGLMCGAFFYFNIKRGGEVANLTEKQKKFVNEYLIDLNATQAAIRAGYSKKTADVQAARLLTNVKVQAYLQKKQTDLQKRTEITQDMVLKELASIGFSDIKDFAEVIKQNYTDNDGIEKSYLAVDIKLTASIPTEKRKAIAGIKQGKEGIEIKLNDKLKALELLGKHIGMFKDGDRENDTQLSKLDEVLGKIEGEI